MNRENDFFLQFSETGTSVFMGVVEDRDDPAQMGRVRVRIFGLHPMDRTEVPTHTLPWATVILPTTEAAMSGIGSGAPKIIEGTWVVGFFRDGISCQDPMIFGCVLSNAAPKWTGPANLPEPEDLRILTNTSNLGQKTSKTVEKNKRNEELKAELSNPSGEINQAVQSAITSKLQELNISSMSDFPNMFDNPIEFNTIVNDIKTSITDSLVTNAIPKIVEKFDLPSTTDLIQLKENINTEVSKSVDNYMRNYFLTMTDQISNQT